MKPTVILLHGLARTCRSLDPIRQDLHRAAFPTWSETYPSRKASITELADRIGTRIEQEVSNQRLVAVTHSMGGIIARHLASRLKFEQILMLAPPNEGSRAARALRGNALFHRTFGPAFHEVQYPDAWPVPSCPVGVIAGTKGASFGTPHSWILRAMGVFASDEPNDGVIALSETCLDDMAAFATVPASHTWIMRHPTTRRLVLEFMADGRFAERAEGA